MKWGTIVFMAVVFAVCQPNTVHLAGAKTTATATNNLHTSALNGKSAAFGSERQNSADTIKYGYEGNGVLSIVLSNELINTFSHNEPLQELFIPSNTSHSSKPSPEPATLFLFGSGLAGCIFIFRRRMVRPS